MVQEVRRVIFSTDELYSAIEGYRRMTPNFLPLGKIIGCSVEENAIRVTLRPPGKTKQPVTTHIIKGAEAVKPLLRFCLENNIMMPKEGQKSLYVKDGAASLYIVLNVNLEVASFTPEDESTDALPQPEIQIPVTTLPKIVANTSAPFSLADIEKDRNAS